MAEWSGFTPATVRFLNDLEANNNKIWFEAHKEDYRQFVQAPLEGLALALNDTMAGIDPGLVTLPQKAISRIYRDTRFSKDKSPYKTALWVTFKRPLKDWQDSPAYFFEITPRSYRYGMGFYLADRNTMDRLRGRIDNNPREFRETIAFYARQKTFVIEGEKYKKILSDSVPPEFLDWYQRKNLYLVSNHAIDDILFSSRLVAELAAGFDLLAPFYHYLWKQKP